MRVSNDFVLREIAGEHILVPVGAAVEGFNGMIAMNDVADSCLSSYPGSHR